MAAQIPIKQRSRGQRGRPAKVREDKEREASDGHDGTWVAHPGLVPAGSRGVRRQDAAARPARPAARGRQRQCLSTCSTVPPGTITEQGLRVNVNVGLRYLESWLRGTGCVPIFNLMEDAATCEISRTQIWQWIKHPRGVLEDGRKVTAALVRGVMAEELEKIRADLGPATFERSKFDAAARCLRRRRHR